MDFLLLFYRIKVEFTKRDKVQLMEFLARFTGTRKLSPTTQLIRLFFAIFDICTICKSIKQKTREIALFIVKLLAQDARTNRQ